VNSKHNEPHKEWLYAILHHLFSLIEFGNKKKIGGRALTYASREAPGNYTCSI